MATYHGAVTSMYSAYVIRFCRHTVIKTVRACSWRRSSIMKQIIL